MPIDKTALVKHFCKYHDLTEKPPVSQCFKVTLEEQSKAIYLNEYEDEWFHKNYAELTLKNDFSPYQVVAFYPVLFFLKRDFSLCGLTLLFSYLTAAEL